MSGPIPGRFGPDEVSGLDGRTPAPAELADAGVAARELERLATDAPIAGAAFTDRVMAAVFTLVPGTEEWASRPDVTPVGCPGDARR